jgi:hypothetical protein
MDLIAACVISLIGPTYITWIAVPFTDKTALKATGGGVPVDLVTVEAHYFAVGKLVIFGPIILAPSKWGQKLPTYQHSLSA